MSWCNGEALAYDGNSLRQFLFTSFSFEMPDTWVLTNVMFTDRKEVSVFTVSWEAKKPMLLCFLSVRVFSTRVPSHRVRMSPQMPQSSQVAKMSSVSSMWIWMREFV